MPQSSSGKDIAAPTVQTQLSSPTYAISTMPPHPKANILLVDDQVKNLLALEAVLSSLQQNLVRASSGQEALRHLLDREFAVILLDVQMPDMDGFETAELIRTRPKNQSIPIIFITAFSKNDGLIFKGYDAGAIDYLFKPIVPEILRSKVALFIDLFNKTAEVQRQAAQLTAANRTLQNSHDALELRVCERTAELVRTNEELRVNILEQRRTEAALRESEERFRIVAESVSDVIYEWDIATGELKWYGDIDGLLGCEPETSPRTLAAWSDRIFPDDQIAFLTKTETCLKSGKAFHEEYRIVHQNGTYRVWLDRGRATFDAEGRPGKWYGSILDITIQKQTEADLYQMNLELEQRVADRTKELSENNQALKKEILERQQTESALRQSETRYRAIVEDQTELICRFQLDGTIVFVNAAYCRYFGLTPEQLIGHRYEPVIFAADRARVSQLVNSISRENPTVMIENRVVVNGEVRWTQWINRSLFNEQGDFVEFQAVGRDVTVRKQTEAALEESQRMVQKIADTAPVILSVYDLLEERNVYINREITDLLGYTPEELRVIESGLPRSLLHPDDLSLFSARKQQWETAQEGYIMQAQYRMQHRDGEWRYFQSQETLFARTAEGVPKQILCAAVDITATKQLEALRQAEEQLQASLREKEVLLKEIHHRVKNNLQIVDSLLRLQSRQIKNSQVAEILLESQNRIKSIALIHEKLYQSEDLARIEFAEYIPNLVVHLFGSYNTHASRVSLNIQVDELSLEIDTAIPCGLIINELVSNALKYAFPAHSKDENEAEGELSVELHGRDEPLITLVVSDNGVGMPEAFDPMEAKSLGLKLVWGLVEQLEGTIDLDCRQGTRFVITFPGE